jgi:hypothetical protein
VTRRSDLTLAVRPVMLTREGDARLGDRTQEPSCDQTCRGRVRSSANVHWHQLSRCVRGRNVLIGRWDMSGRLRVDASGQVFPSLESIGRRVLLQVR